MRGTIIAVSTSKRKGERKTNVASANLLVGLGLEGAAHAGFAHRQVSLLPIESIKKMREKGLKVNPGDFAENLTTSGLHLSALPIGTELKVGQVLLKVSQIGKKCHAHCDIYRQAGDCIMPKEGIFAVVVAGGQIAAGDTIEVIIHV